MRGRYSLRLNSRRSVLLSQGFGSNEEADRPNKRAATVDQLASVTPPAGQEVASRSESGRGSARPGRGSDSRLSCLSLETISENANLGYRFLDGLRAVINAAAVDPGEYSKTIIFISSGFRLGRQSISAPMSNLLDNIISSAKRSHLRLFAINPAHFPGCITVNRVVGAPGDYLDVWEKSFRRSRSGLRVKGNCIIVPFMGYLFSGIPACCCRC
jgi:hypothetical protein